MQSASSILSGVLPALIRRAPLTQDKVDFAWRTVVGPAVARATRVRLHEGVLVVAAGDARWAREVERARAVVLARLADLLGSDVVRVIRIDHT
jgi:predicted nucleic acid-binding Zn ribbon protein